MSEDDPTKPDLSTVDTDHLIDELQARAAAFVLGFTPKANPENQDLIQYAGSRSGCFGLVHMLDVRLTQVWMNEKSVPDGDDDD